MKKIICIFSFFLSPGALADTDNFKGVVEVSVKGGASVYDVFEDPNSAVNEILIPKFKKHHTGMLLRDDFGESMLIVQAGLSYCFSCCNDENGSAHGTCPVQCDLQVPPGTCGVCCLDDYRSYNSVLKPGALNYVNDIWDKPKKRNGYGFSEAIGPFTYDKAEQFMNMD